MSTTLVVVGILLGASLLWEGLLFVQYVAPINGKTVFEQDPVGGDFAVFWSAAKLAGGDRLSEIFDHQKFHQAQTQLLGHEYQLRLWHYPPYFLFYLSLLSWLEYLPAYIMWTIVTFALFASTVVWTQRPTWVVVAMILAPASFVNVLDGQNGFLSGALFVGGLLCLERNPLTAGFLLGLLSYKPQMCILIPIVLLAGRNWKALLSISVTIILLVASSLVVHGSDVWELYLTVTTKNTEILLHKVRGFLTFMMPTVFMSGRILGLDVMTNYALQIAVMLCVMAGTYWAIRRTADPIFRLAVTAIGVFLSSPYAYNYDMTIVSAAIALLVAQRERDVILPVEGFTLALAWFLPIGVITFNAAGFPIGPLILGIVFVLLLRRAGREATETMRPQAQAAVN